VNVAPTQASAGAPTENLAGLVERVTFHNEENGFCVLRLKARGQRDLVTVVGHAAMISAGERIQAAGTWTNDHTHGLQFRANFLKATPPTTLDGIERYLGSGMICGIGPAYAKRLVRALGEAVFDVIEADPSRCARSKASVPCGRSASPPAGRAERRARDHAAPARPRRRHLAGGADLQDLRRRSRGGHQREPVPPRARHPHHQLQDRRSGRSQARRRQGRHGAGPRRRELRARRAVRAQGSDPIRKTPG